jgi:hypothetical protein
MLFGGAASQIGWFLLGFGSIFFWIFAWHADLSGWRFRPGSVAQTSGDALGCSDTHYHVGGTESHRGTPVYKNSYRYTVNGNRYEGASYATGRCVTDGSVTVEYLLSQPEVSRIMGMRRDLLSPWTILAALLPGAGLALVIAGLVKGRRAVRLLRDGLPAPARLIKKASTGATTFGHADYRMTFEYSAQSGAIGRVTVRTHLPERLEDEQRELLLYDPSAVASAVLLDDLPGTVSVDETGQPKAGGSRRFLLLPALTILGNGLYIWRHWIA